MFLFFGKLNSVFFIIRLGVLSLNEDFEYRDLFFILFILSCIFVIIPLAMNVTQLHLEISKWRDDEILQQTGVSKWIKSNVKMLYFITAISGSSFASVSICNSYLLFWPIFSMGLPQYHKSIFTNKRFTSVVLFEV